MPTKISFLKGDITEMAVDGIVNSANTQLQMESGVAGAIRRKGGARIQEACEQIGRIRLGEAAVTTAGNLRAFYVIHAASMEPGGQATTDSVRLATRNSLLRAEEKALRSIAFPAVGTGAAGFSMDQCSEIMLGEVLNHLKSVTSLEKINFVLFDDATLRVFEDTYAKLAGQDAGGRT